MKLFKGLPGWLYEPLPYLYFAVGLVTMFKLNMLTGRLSGLLLVSAGVIIWHMRFQYRRTIDSRRRSKRRRITRHI
jgi:hypothetical protein